MSPIEIYAEAVMRPQGLLLDERLHYLGYGRNPSHCGIRVYVVGDGMVVVISELPDNPGTSVTNAIEQIASELLPNLVGDPNRLDTITWIEHYPASPPLSPPSRKRPWLYCGRLEETFDLVTFAGIDPPRKSWIGQFFGYDKCVYGCYRGPAWRRISRTELEILIGGMRWQWQ